MPSGKKWSSEEEALLTSVFIKYPTVLAVDHFLRRCKEGWPTRTKSAIRKRAYILGLAKTVRDDYFTVAQLAQELGVTRARIKGWYYNSSYSPCLRVHKVNQLVLTRKTWVQDFLWPSKVEGSRSYRLPHRFHTLDEMDDSALEWLLEGDEDLAQAIWEFRQSQLSSSPSTPTPVHLQEAADRLGVSRFRLWSWAFKSTPALKVKIEESPRRVFTTAQDLREFLSHPPVNSAIDYPDRLHLVHDASVEGLRWLFQGEFTNPQDLDVHIEAIINRVNQTDSSKPPMVFKRSCRDGKILGRYNSMRAAARACFFHVHTIRKSVRTGHPPKDCDFYFEQAKPIYQSLAARQLQELAS
mgnify:CR=1 FL=1